MEASGFASIAIAFFVVAVSPGPATLGCASVSMAHGRRAGLAFGAGLGLGLAVWGLLAALGLGAVLATSAPLLTAVKLAGGCYLLWLAWLSGRSAASPGTPESSPVAAGRWVWSGVVLNLSNPKAVFAWLATLALGLGPDAGPLGVAVATAICMMIGFAVYTIWAIGFSLPMVMAAYRRFRRWADGVIAVLFAAAGFSLIRSALMRSSP